MYLKILILDKDKENLLLFNNPKTGLLELVGGTVFSTELAFKAAKRIMKSDFDIDVEREDIQFVRHEVLHKASVPAEDNYIVLITLNGEYEFPNTYSFVPVNSTDIIYKTNGSGSVYTYLEEGFKLF